MCRGPRGDAEEMDVRCAWCGRYRVNGRWKRLHVLSPGRETTHGICPTCFVDVLADLPSRGGARRRRALG